MCRKDSIEVGDQLIVPFFLLCDEKEGVLGVKEALQRALRGAIA